MLSDPLILQLLVVDVDAHGNQISFQLHKITSIMNMMCEAYCI